MSDTQAESARPRVFISYSRDEALLAWVRNFATRLRDAGLGVSFDEWDLRFGGETTTYMSKSVRTADRVLVICTEAYRNKVEEPRGGSGYESTIINGELLRNLSTDKFIPVIPPGSTPDCRPSYLATRRYVDLSQPASEAATFSDLLRELLGSAGTKEIGPAAVRPEREPLSTAPPIPVHLAMSVFAPEDEDAVITTALVTTDEPQRLTSQLLELRKSLLRDPRVPSAKRDTLKNASLMDMLEDEITSARALEWLTTAPFSAYVYYAKRKDLSDSDEATLEKLVLVPLVHRLSMKSERVVQISAGDEDISDAVTEAIRRVEQSFGRKVPAPDIRKSEAGLSDFATIVAAATATHLAMPNDDHATALFESVRTRIRFAQNVISGERHLRDENPLP